MSALKDITGTPVFDGAAVVIERADNAGRGNARWKLRLAKCGHELTVEGIQIRAYEKKGHTPRCLLCVGEARA